MVLDKHNKNTINLSIPKDTENILMGSHYLNIYGPFQEKWRNVEVVIVLGL